MLFLRIISNLSSTKEKQEASEVEKKKIFIPFEMILLILCSSKYQFIQQ